MQNIANEPTTDLSLPASLFSLVACYMVLATVFIGQML